jgi:hypothetical protein
MRSAFMRTCSDSGCSQGLETLEAFASRQRCKEQGIACTDKRVDLLAASMYEHSTGTGIYCTLEYVAYGNIMHLRLWQLFAATRHRGALGTENGLECCGPTDAVSHRDELLTCTRTLMQHCMEFHQTQETRDRSRSVNSKLSPGKIARVVGDMVLPIDGNTMQNMGASPISTQHQLLGTAHRRGWAAQAMQ